MINKLTPKQLDKIDKAFQAIQDKYKLDVKLVDFYSNEQKAEIMHKIWLQQLSIGAMRRLAESMVAR